MTKSGPSLAIRADGGGDIGLGHVMRCSALARALLALDIPLYWLTRTPQALPSGLDTILTVIPLPDTADEAEDLPQKLSQIGITHLIADWQLPGAAVCENLRNTGVWLALIGGSGGAVAADLRIHQRFAAGAPDTTDAAKCDGSEVLLLAPGYAGLPRRKVEPVAGRILISLGGSETGLLDDIVLALDSLPAMDALRVDLRRPAATDAPLQADGLLKAMCAADLAILGAGTSLHEAAATGLPVIALPVAGNQRERASQFEALGLGLNLDPTLPDFAKTLRAAVTRLLGSAALRAQFAEAGQSRVDGRGAERVARRIQTALHQNANAPAIAYDTGNPA